jgi:hypothetical protein
METDLDGTDATRYGSTYYYARRHAESAAIHGRVDSVDILGLGQTRIGFVY